MNKSISHSFRSQIQLAKESLAHLLYPKLCAVCETELSKETVLICSFCVDNLPYTHFEGDQENSPVNQLFWGRVPIERAYALLTYRKNSGAKPLLHRIKYKDQPDLAKIMGEKLGEQLKLLDWTHSLDALIPVPIHPKKKFIRGYNQSEELAIGVSKAINCPIDNHFIERSLHTDSQTKKGRFARWDNIEGAFRKKASNLQFENYKHIGIVDDVITTGATLERIVLQIHEKNPDLRISLISLAFAQ